MADRDEAADRLRARLERLEPAGGSNGSEPSDLRLRIRDTFDAMAAARGRGVSWQQIADAMNDAGAEGAEGAGLDWRRVKSLYHAERYARGGKRKRRSGQAAGRRKAAQVTSAPEAPAAVRKGAEDAHPAHPAPTATGDPANPYAEIDRRQEDKRRRRQRADRSAPESFFELTPETETDE